MAECEENKWEFCIQGKNYEPSTASNLPLLFLFYISNRLPDGWTQYRGTETAPNFQAQQVIAVRAVGAHPLHCTASLRPRKLLSGCIVVVVE